MGRRSGLGALLVAKLICPYCGRHQPIPAQAGVVACDGCERRFDPAKVRFQPASLPKRVAGWSLLVIGLLLLLGGISAALRHDSRDPDLPMRLVGTFLLPAVAILAGSALGRGRLVVDESRPDAEIE